MMTLTAIYAIGVAIVTLLSIVTVIVYAFKPKAGTGKLNDGESTNYSIKQQK